MGLVLKIVLLVLAEIVLIVACVYYHADTFEAKDKTVVVKQSAQEITPTQEVKTSSSKNPSFVEEIKTRLSSLFKEESNETPQESVTAVKEEMKKADVLNKSEKASEPTVKAVEKVTKEVKKELQPEVKKVETKVVAKKIIEKIPSNSETTLTDKKVKALFEKKKKELEEQKESTPKVDEKTVIPIAKIQQKINTLVKTERIIFKRLSTDVTQKSMQTIEKIAQILKENPTINVEVGGHTDAKGDDKVNAYISKHRALSVRKLLIKMGIKKERLSAKGYGESQPIVKNDAQGYSMLNRRVEFKIIKE